MEKSFFQTNIAVFRKKNSRNYKKIENYLACYFLSVITIIGTNRKNCDDSILFLRINLTLHVLNVSYMTFKMKRKSYLNRGGIYSGWMDEEIILFEVWMGVRKFSLMRIWVCELEKWIYYHQVFTLFLDLYFIIRPFYVSQEACCTIKIKESFRPKWLGLNSVFWMKCLKWIDRTRLIEIDLTESESWVC